MASGQRETRAGGVRALVVVGEGEGVLDGVSALVGQLAKLAANMHTPIVPSHDAPPLYPSLAIPLPTNSRVHTLVRRGANGRG